MTIKNNKKGYNPSIKILIVYRGKYPVFTASSKRLTNYVKALRSENHNVIVLPIYMVHKSIYLEVILSFFLPIKAFLSVITKAKYYSAVYIYGPGWVFKFSIALAAKLSGKPVGTELNEKPYSIHGNGRSDFFLRRFESINEFCLKKIVYPNIDGFIVISQSLVDYTTRYGKHRVIICKVPILVDYYYYQKQTLMPDCNFPYIINTATINDHKDGIINVFKAFSLVIKNGYKLHFYLTSKTAPPALLEQINLIISENNLETNITFLGELSEESLLTYQANCSMVVLNKIESDQNKYNFATKLGEYMALGKPIITTKVGEVKNYLKDNISCIYIDPSSPEEISEAIIRLLDDSEFAKRIGEAGREIAKNEFDYKIHSEKISNFFLALITLNREQS